MLIGAALIELALSESESIKARRSLARAVKDRLRQRFNLSVAEVGDPSDRRSVCVGCVAVGVDPRHVRSRMEQVVRFVEGLGLAELVGDDIMVARIDELEDVTPDDPDEEPTWEEE
jgi:uncharacterized protein YlxP (DUF503 family)